MANAPTLNTDGLAQTPSGSELREFRAQHAEVAASLPSFALTVGLPVGVLGAMALFGMLLFTAFGMSFQRAGMQALTLNTLMGFIPLVMFGVPALVLLLFRLVQRRNELALHYRLWRFATDNHLDYRAAVPNPPFPGMIFQYGTSRTARSILSVSTPRHVEIGNFTYATSDGNRDTKTTWGYVAVKLNTPLPNIVLDARSNNILGSNLPVSLQRHQRLSLEGDFDKHFTLYCPEGYQADALYLFTPDIMQRFLGAATGMDVEIVDDWLFFYGNHRFSTTNPQQWAYLFGVVGAMLDKLAQWERWRDDRLAEQAASAPPSQDLPQAPAHLAVPTTPPGVAEPGQRLKRNGSRLFWYIVLGGLIGTLLVKFMPDVMRLLLH